MFKKNSLTLRPAAGALLLLAAIFVLGGVPALEAVGVDCGGALTRCLNEQSWWERIFNFDYCFVGFLFCIFYVQ